MNVFKRLKLNIHYMDEILDQKKNFDLIKRNIKIANQDACIYYLDDFVKDKNLQDTIEKLLDVKEEIMKEIKEARELVEQVITYPEVSIENNMEQIILNLLSGVSILFVDHMADAIMIDARKYPNRSINEPEKDKILRGSKDGFVEAAISNVSMIRRRIRSTDLTFEHKTIGEISHSDVIICYLKGKVDEKQLSTIMEKINSIQVESLTMGSESLAELLVKRKWCNPFPKVKFSERPDVVVANILEGRIIILVDNTPSAIILPTYFTDFFEEAEDYYFPPPTAIYFKLSRMLITLLTLLITPLWFLAVSNADKLPEWLSFLKVAEMNQIPIIFQLLAIEFVIETIKRASINTPSMISSSISLIGAVILGDIAITTKLIIPEVMLYTAFVALGYYSQPSYQLGYAIKYLRVVTLVFISILNVYGFFIGMLLGLIVLCCNKTITGESYLYPIIPFDKIGFQKIFIRKKLK